MTQTTPPKLSPEGARLATALRDLRASTGLSLAALAAKTTFSKSSWERYLNGKTLPPRQAVQELCGLAGEADGRCLALWEIAESEWSGRAAVTPTGTQQQRPLPTPGPELPPPAAVAARKGVAAVVLASVGAAAAGGVTVALFLLPRQDNEARSSPPPSPTWNCRGTACEGKSPMDTRCAAVPGTLASHHTSTGAFLELRYSKRCGASWARMWSTRIGDRLEITVAGRSGDVRSAEIKTAADANAYIFTPMTATRPGSAVRACFRPASGGKRECFEARVG